MELSSVLGVASSELGIRGTARLPNLPEPFAIQVAGIQPRERRLA
jgi:hypothetical protein